MHGDSNIKYEINPLYTQLLSNTFSLFPLQPRIYFVYSYVQKAKGKGKVHRIIAHEGPEEE